MGGPVKKTCGLEVVGLAEYPEQLVGIQRCRRKHATIRKLQFPTELDVQTAIFAPSVASKAAGLTSSGK
jgi:hypothetical protein